MVPDLPQTEAAIVEMTNAFRKASALQHLNPNGALAAAARAFADYLARTGKFAHDADGREPAVRALAQGYGYCLVAENLAWNLDSRGYASAQLAREVVEGWKASPGHRANLLLAGATETGVAVVRAPDSPKFLSVQLVGRPDSLKVTFSIQNQTGKAVYYSLGAQSDRIQPREIVTHGDCAEQTLSIDRGLDPPLRFSPRTGDRFVIRPATPRGIDVINERK
jgi:Cysteine-rich secretory protein family